MLVYPWDLSLLAGKASRRLRDSLDLSLKMIYVFSWYFFGYGVSSGMNIIF